MTKFTVLALIASIAAAPVVASATESLETKPVVAVEAPATSVVADIAADTTPVATPQAEVTGTVVTEEAKDGTVKAAVETEATTTK